MAVLTATDLVVKQGETLALDGLTLEVNQGEVVALIGHNGAGKSTFFKTVMGLIEPRDGTLTIAGETLPSALYKQQVIYIPEQPFLLPELTVFQHFQLYLESYNQYEDEKVNEIYDLANRFEIAGELDQFPLELSKGMKQKAQLIARPLKKSDFPENENPIKTHSQKRVNFS
jgi:ABC-2 type transport system ATP-binding protein